MLVSDGQLTGRVEVDFLIIKKGKCLVLEVDGSQHSDEGHSIRDYAKDRVLLRSGVPTVRFTARDCLMQPKAVVAEILTVLESQ
jgi:very-short-patch-repair endonuclease